MEAANKKFETARTRKFRTQPLSESDEKTIGHVEDFGCSVIHVERTEYGLGWSYTIGIFDTAGKPEIITVGLPTPTAHTALNEAARLQQTGVDLVEGRHHDLIGEVECEFRPVDPKWIARFMNGAVWYYGNADFPVLQAVYPDLENRFPEDAGFDKAFERPLMQPDAEMNRVAEDFWAAADPDSSLYNWKFPDGPHSTAYLSKAVHECNEEITFVSHDADDGAWQFLGDSMSDTGGVVVCLHHPIDKDRSLVDLADLPLGWYAERDRPGEPWIRRPHPDASVED